MRKIAVVVNIVGEYMTDVSSWRVLVCYLDAQAALTRALAPAVAQVPPLQPELARLADAAGRALGLGLGDRADVRIGAMFAEANRWLTSGPRVAVSEDDVDLLREAQPVVAALCPERHRPEALDLLDPGPLLAERDRILTVQRRHVLRGVMRRLSGWPALAAPPIIGPAAWRTSLWDSRADQAVNSRAAIHAAAGIAAAVWARLDPVHDPAGFRDELYRRGAVKTEPASLFSDLPPMSAGSRPPPQDADGPGGKALPAALERRAPSHAWPIEIVADPA